LLDGSRRASRGRIDAAGAVSLAEPLAPSVYTGNHLGHADAFIGQQPGSWPTKGTIDRPDGTSFDEVGTILGSDGTRLDEVGTIIGSPGTRVDEEGAFIGQQDAT
jgi:hypothetical protein